MKRTLHATFVALTASLVGFAATPAFAVDSDTIIVNVLEDSGFEPAEFPIEFDARYHEMHGIKPCPEPNIDLVKQTLDAEIFHGFAETMRDKLEDNGFEPHPTIHDFVCERLVPAQPPACP